MSDFVDSLKHVHFVAIGGIGVSALARMMFGMGKKVTGSDMSRSRITDDLSDIGIKVTIGHSEKNVDSSADLLVYSPAIPEQNPERVNAREKNIKELSYPEFLGIVSQASKTIAISGTHGKTTTTAMIADVFIKAEQDPTVVVGSLLARNGSNFIQGKSEYFIAEACEYKRSFLNLSPFVLVITNVDEDHLDYYKDLADIQSAFKEMALKVPTFGAIVADVSHPSIKPILESIDGPRIIDYMEYMNDVPELSVIGFHNRLNAACAMAVGMYFGLDKEVIKEALAAFAGTWRRLEYIGKNNKEALLYDDYGHNPTEITATLSALTNHFPDKDVYVVFQPHLYSRTKYFLSKFADCFKNVKKVFVAPIYAAREENDPSITSYVLVDEMTQAGVNCIAVDDTAEIAKMLNDETDSNSVIITVGAGDIYTIHQYLIYGK